MPSLASALAVVGSLRSVTGHLGGKLELSIAAVSAQLASIERLRDLFEGAQRRPPEGLCAVTLGPSSMPLPDRVRLIGIKPLRQRDDAEARAHAISIALSPAQGGGVTPTSPRGSQATRRSALWRQRSSALVIHAREGEYALLAALAGLQADVGLEVAPVLFAEDCVALGLAAALPAAKLSDLRIERLVRALVVAVGCGRAVIEAVIIGDERIDGDELRAGVRVLDAARGA